MCVVDADLLNSMGVKIGLIDTHGCERGGVIVVLLLFYNLLSGVITRKRSWRLGTRRKWF